MTKLMMNNLTGLNYSLKSFFKHLGIIAMNHSFFPNKSKMKLNLQVLNEYFWVKYIRHTIIDKIERKSSKQTIVHKCEINFIENKIGLALYFIGLRPI